MENELFHFCKSTHPKITKKQAEGRTDTTTYRGDSLLKRILLLQMQNLKIKLILIELAQHKLLKQDSDKKH